jgi:predicted CXXCH cytochrome family protein
MEESMKVGALARTLYLAVAGACALIASHPSLAGTIVGSEHDFSTTGWAGGQICIACHTPHKAITSVADAPLWNHALSNQTYTLYASPTLNATLTQPGGGSKLCLSCHDGTVALNSFGGTTGTIFIGNGAANIGTSLADDHPLGFLYDAALVTADPSLAPTTKAVTIGSGTQTKSGTIANNLLFGGKLECASCHDVHNTFTAGTHLLKVSNAGSALCLTCHQK